MVRDVGPGAYRLALSLAFDTASAERVLLEAFGSLGPSVARVSSTIELREKLYARIRQQAARRPAPTMPDAPPDPTAAVSENLHLRIVERPPADNTGLPAFTMAQPNGTAMAVAPGNLDRGGLANHLWIVSADGQAIQVAGAEFYPGFPGSF